MREKYWIVLFFYLIGCQPDKIQEDKLKEGFKPSFKTRADTELFFKNVRQIYYTKETPKDSKIDLYRFNEFSQNPNKPSIQAVIAHNWSYNEAYILMEFNAYFQDADTIQIEIKDLKDNERKLILYKDKSSKEDFYNFAREIYQGILAEEHFFLVENNNQKIAFLEGDIERNIFRKTMVDYYRLIGIL